MSNRKGDTTWGILGGRFDPIHNGHITLATDCLRLAQLDRILLVVSYEPPHKAEGCAASFADRLEMARLAIGRSRQYGVSDIERRLEGPGYTLEVVRALKEEHPERSFAFIIGADNIGDLRNWHKPEEICREVRLVAGARPGYELAEIDVPAGCTVEFFDTGEVDVSGSEIRRRLAEGLDREELATLVPSAVADYIFDKGLYRA